MQAKSDVVNEEVFLAVDTTANLNLVSKLLEHAGNLGRAGSPESASKTKDHRKEEMLNTYKIIVTQFPKAEQADFALYQMGRLYYDYFQEWEAARDAFNKLVQDYPESRYAEDARSYKQRSEDELAKGN